MPTECWPSTRPAPTYCSHAHRQAAYERRLQEREGERIDGRVRELLGHEVPSLLAMLDA